MKRIKVMIVDDHEVVRMGLRAALEWAGRYTSPATVPGLFPWAALVLALTFVILTQRMRVSF